MHFTVSELRTFKTIEREADLEASKLLGDAPDFVQFRHPVKAYVKAELVYSEVLITGRASTVVNFDCSRCLANFESRIQGEFRQSFPLETESIDATPYIRE